MALDSILVQKQLASFQDELEKISAWQSYVLPTAVGTTTGALVGAGTGALVDKEDRKRGALTGAGVGAGIGTGIGLGVGRMRDIDLAKYKAEVLEKLRKARERMGSM